MASTDRKNNYNNHEPVNLSTYIHYEHVNIVSRQAWKNPDLSFKKYIIMKYSWNSIAVIITILRKSQHGLQEIQACSSKRALLEFYEISLFDAPFFLN